MGLTLVTPETKSPRTAGAILFEICVAINEIEDQIALAGLNNTGEEWVLKQLKEVHAKLAEVLQKV